MPLLPSQIEGAKFLAGSGVLLADEAGYGKTAQAIAAADYVFARTILVVTTASARANWLNEFRQWSVFPRKAVAVYTTTERIADDADVVVVAWSNVIADVIKGQLAARRWDVLILDESHYAKTLSAQRTKVVFGALAPQARQVWCLSGTPMANSPADIYPMLRTLAPDALQAEGFRHNYDSFVSRYCVTKTRWIGQCAVETVIGGQNLGELNKRLAPIMLRRRSEGLPDIRYSVYTLHVDPKMRAKAAEMEEGIDAEALLEAAETGTTDDLDLHLGPLRRLTGTLKAHAAVDLLSEDLENGLDKVVVFAWHRDVIEILRAGLSRFGVVGIDGATPANTRQGEVERFQHDPATRVFVGQIQAAGEAITLTAANQCFFVEASFVPKDMGQAVRRIRRRGQTRPCLCRVAALEGSIDEALMRIVTRKVATIATVLGD